METVGSPGVAWTRWDTLQVSGPTTPLRVALPAPSAQVVVGVMTETGRVAAELDGEGFRGPLVVSARGEPHHAAYASFTLPEPATEVELRVGAPGYITFVGHRAAGSAS